VTDFFIRISIGFRVSDLEIRIYTTKSGAGGRWSERSEDLVDRRHSSDEEKLTFKRELRKVENAFSTKILDYEGKLLISRSEIIKSESSGHFWLHCNANGEQSLY
jgi:hypothetical protein